jgi:CubicO group peptidase (beta-lactamase class C family)
VHRFSGSPPEQRRTYVELILREPPEVEPGTTYLYSNRNYAVAGAIAERIANVSWEDLMERRLFRPLAMTTAGFGAMGTPGRVDQPWQHRWANNTRVPIAPGPLSDNPAAIGPAATVHCSIGDWASFISAHLPGQKRSLGLLKSETLQRLHTPWHGGSYGFGWLTVDRAWAGGPALTHTGTNTQNFAVAWLAPARDFAVLAATNQGGQGAFPGCDETASALIRSRGQ